MTSLKKMCTILTVLILTIRTNGAPIDPNESDANEEKFVWPTEFDPITEIDLKSYQALPETMIDPPIVMNDVPEGDIDLESLPETMIDPPIVMNDVPEGDIDLESLPETMIDPPIVMNDVPEGDIDLESLPETMIDPPIVMNDVPEGDIDLESLPETMIDPPIVMNDVPEGDIDLESLPETMIDPPIVMNDVPEGDIDLESLPETMIDPPIVMNDEPEGDLDLESLPEKMIDTPIVMNDEPENTDGRFKRKAIARLCARWPNAVVSYQYNAAFDTKEKAIIQGAMDQWTRETCITFKPVTSGPRVQFRNDNIGCYSTIGRDTYDRPQTLNLHNNCMYHGIIAHEIGHAIGFFHEQSRPDRDNYVTIHKENIYPGFEYNFAKYSTDLINTYNVPYDYLSDMHYGKYSLTKNGKVTVETVDSGFTDKIGNRKGLSYEDVHLANLMYSCAGKSGCTVPKCTKGFVDKDCNCKCKNTLDNPTKNCK